MKRKIVALLVVLAVVSWTAVTLADMALSARAAVASPI